MTTFEDELRTHGYLVYKNKGSSMLPLLRENRDLMVIRAKTEGFRKNDAVLYRRASGQYILHRITRVNGDGTYLIIGDNCIEKELVRADQLMGILTEFRRDGKTTSVSHPLYRLYVVLLPVRRVFLRLRRCLRCFAKKLLGRT